MYITFAMRKSMLDMPIPGSFRNKDHFEKIIFACGRSYVTFAMRKSMLDMPIPGSFSNKESEAKRVPRPFGPQTSD